MYVPPDKVHKALDKALETYTPHDWRFIGEAFRYSMWDQRKLENFRELLVGFSLADSRARGLTDDESGW